MVIFIAAALFIILNIVLVLARLGNVAKTLTLGSSLLWSLYLGLAMIFLIIATVWGDVAQGTFNEKNSSPLKDLEPEIASSLKQYVAFRDQCVAGKPLPEILANLKLLSDDSPPPLSEQLTEMYGNASWPDLVSFISEFVS